MDHSAKTSGYTLVVQDDQKLITTNSNITVPSGSFNAGHAVTIYNNSSSDISITGAGGVTVYLGGTSTTGTRTLSGRGIATIVCVISNNTFVITGAGLS